MTLTQSLRSRDAGLAALRRSGRAGIVAPGLFALSDRVIGNPTMAVFTAFGAISTLLFVDFGGPLRRRAAAQSALVLAGAVLVCLGTLASRSTWSATLAMAVVGFAVLFSGIVSSVLAGASTSLLAGFIIAVMLPGPVGTVPDRLAGYLMAGAASVIAVTLLWPMPAHEPLRRDTARACTLLARRLRAEVDCVRCGFTPDSRTTLEGLAAEASDAVAALRSSFYGTPYRPTGLTTEARTLVKLVDEVVWLEEILRRTPLDRPGTPSDPEVCEVKLAAADLLEHGAERMEADREGAGAGAPAASRSRVGSVGPGGLDADLARLRDARAAMARTVTTVLPAPADAPRPEGDAAGSAVTGFISSLEPGFRTQEMSFAISAISANIALGVAARDRSWRDRLLGRRPEGVTSPLSSAQERAGAHVEPHSVWLHNSLRGACSLAAAVLAAELTGVQHAFWVVFGTLAVIRSSALLTGQNALRAMLGTVAGIAIGGGLIYAVGSDTTALWCLLPPAIVFTGLAPAAISFAAGQAGFTATLLILFNIIAPAGWSIGLVRIEDIAIGCGVSVAVGVLFWPRGAGAALARAAADALADSSRYLRAAVGYGAGRCDALAPGVPDPDGERYAAAAAARRLDDAFRGFLAERGTKRVPLADVTALLTAVGALRLTADAVLDLWRTGGGDARGGDRTAARAELLAASVRLSDWYEAAARALTGDGEVPDRLARDEAAGKRLVDAVRRDLTGTDGQATGTAVRMIWTADHLDAVRRVQAAVVGPARAAAALQRERDTVLRRPAGRRADA